jgi:uncharacterized RDD family membrane protein YckC
MTTAITVLNKANVPTGPFTREQVAEKLKTGEFSLEDLAFVEGLTQWTPLREVMAKVDSAAVAAPIAAPSVFTSPTAPATGAPVYSYAATMQPPGHLVYAGFWLRFVAYIIDILILCIPLGISMLIGGIIVGMVASVTNQFTNSSGGDPSHTANSVMEVGIGIVELVVWPGIAVAAWLYFANMESGPKQATFGKRALGLKVTNLAGEKIGFGQASGRFFGKFVSGITLYIGFIMAGFTERKQALHDLIAGTLVVRK